MNKILGHETYGNEEIRRCSKGNLTGTDDENDDAKTHHNSRHLYLAKEILSKMLIYADDEETYIHYLNQLLVANNLNAKDRATLDDFNILNIDDLPVPKPVKIKTTNKKIKSVDSHRKHQQLKNKGTPS